MTANKLEVRRIGVTSAGTIFGALYALFGLIAGAVITLVSVIGAALTQSLTGVLFGMGVHVRPCHNIKDYIIPSLKLKCSCLWIKIEPSARVWSTDSRWIKS